MNKDKKIIIITLIIAIVLSFVSGFVTYTITINNKANHRVSKKDNKENMLKVQEYFLQYGTYKGENIEYEWDDKTEKMKETSKKEIILKLNSDNTYELSGEKHKFSIVDKDIIVPDFDNSVMFKVTGNNELLMQVGSGIMLSYSK